ncbi:hypothetical protein ACFE04_023146 [Oxalis oulophora]
MAISKQSLTTCVSLTTRYIHLLEACIKSKSLSQAKKIHQHLLITNSLSNNSIFIPKLTHLYISCKQIDIARKLFDEIPYPCVFQWNLMLRAYAWNGPFEESIRLYYLMLELGINPTKYTFPAVLKACSSLQAIDEGKEIHDHVKRLGLSSDIYICTSLVDFYVKCGDLVEASKVFDSMRVRDVVAWNAMISGYSLHGVYEDTIGLLVGMQKVGMSPNSSTIVSMLPTVGDANALWQGKAMHGFSVRRLFDADVVLSTGLLDMYGKCNCIAYARRVFDLMGVNKNEVTWSAIIGAYVSCDLMREALRFFGEMLFENDVSLSHVTLGSVLRACTKLTDLSWGRCLHCYMKKSGFVSDMMVCNTLLDMYSKCGSFDDSARLFDNMSLKDTVSYSALISGCMQNGNAKVAIRIFHEMQLSGIEPDVPTMLGVLPACSHLAALQHGACAHGYSTVRGLTSNTTICNALIDMYSKCGKIGIARKIFDKMQKPDIVSWNAMIVGYGIHGLGTEALLMFHSMRAVDMKPDETTFIGLLSACSHSGLVVEGKTLFSSMSQEFDITPRMDHYICMVDLLSRAGNLDEACKFIEKIPFVPDVRIWNALLAACRVHNNIELGEEVSKKIQSLGPESSGSFVLTSNMYSAVGRWDEAARIRNVQKDQGFKKSPGCSWIEIGGNVHAFIGGDSSHPKSSEINKKLDEFLVEMKKLGYHAESSFVFQDVEEEEKERILLHHSEKLAIAYGDISLSPTKPILITKNLRVCVDCHAAIKLITVITKRKITVRDVSRFHHFSNGNCSCGDFW